MHRVTANFHRGKPVTFEVDGTSTPGYEGETVAAAMLAAGRAHLSESRQGSARGVYCNMGVCFECTVWEARLDEDGKTIWCAERACLLSVRPGMRVRTSSGKVQP
jgi:hypothetical protein